MGITPVLYSFETTHLLLKAWKENRGHALNRSLFFLHPNLERELKEIEFDFIVPIPQNFKRSWRRGHESAFQVALYFSKNLDLSIYSLLSLTDVAPPRQATLDRWDRKYGKNPFRINHELIQFLINERKWLPHSVIPKILIVDDLITSGNTISKASEVLLELFPHALIWAGSLGYRPPKIRGLH